MSTALTDRLAFDFGLLLRERELVALARVIHGPEATKARRRARRREALVGEARARVVVGEEEEAAVDGEEEEVGARPQDVVAGLLCPLAHYKVDDPAAARRWLSSTTDLLGLKWWVGWIGLWFEFIGCLVLLTSIGIHTHMYHRVTRRMAQALFGLTHEGTWWMEPHKSAALRAINASLPPTTPANHHTNQSSTSCPACPGWTHRGTEPRGTSSRNGICSRRPTTSARPAPRTGWRGRA